MSTTASPEYLLFLDSFRHVSALPPRDPKPEEPADDDDDTDDSEEDTSEEKETLQT